MTRSALIDKRPLRLIIADDHPLVLLALDNLLSSHPDMQIVGRAHSVAQLFATASECEFDLAVIDLNMPGRGAAAGCDVLRAFKQRYGRAVIVLTMESDAATLRRAAELEVAAVLSKRDSLELIFAAIASAMADEIYLGPGVRDLIAGGLRDAGAESGGRLLTQRELEVLVHWSSGLGVTEIAALLGRSVKTVSAQKCSAMRKLSLKSNVELYRFAAGCRVTTRGN